MALSPEEILAMATRGAAQAIDSYGQGQIDLAKAQFGNAHRRQIEEEQGMRAMLLLGARIKAENQQLKTKIDAENQALKTRLDAGLEEIRIRETEQRKTTLEVQKGIDDRQKALFKQQLEMADEREKGARIFKTIEQLRGLNAAAPARAEKETDDAYLLRLHDAEIKAQKDFNEKAANALAGDMRNLDSIEDELRASATTTVKGVYTPDAFLMELAMTDPDLEAKVRQLKTKGKGMTTAQALEKAGLTPSYQTAFDSRVEEIKGKLMKGNRRADLIQSSINAKTLRLPPEVATMALSLYGATPGTSQVKPDALKSAAANLVLRAGGTGATATPAAAPTSGAAPKVAPITPVPSAVTRGTQPLGFKRDQVESDLAGQLSGIDRELSREGSWRLGFTPLAAGQSSTLKERAYYEGLRQKRVALVSQLNALRAPQPAMLDAGLIPQLQQRPPSGEATDILTATPPWEQQPSIDPSVYFGL